MSRSAWEAANGLLPARPTLILGQPTLADPSRAPAGKHVLWGYAHVPAAPTGDALRPRSPTAAAAPCCWPARAWPLAPACSPGRSGRADVPRAALAEGDGHGSLLDPADDAERQARPAHAVERLVELVGVADRLTVDGHDQIAGAHAGAVRRAGLLDHADQQAVALGQADR